MLKVLEKDEDRYWYKAEYNGNEGMVGFKCALVF